MDFLESVKAAGVVGAGGAGFPTHVKLNSKAETLVVNAAECEPLIEVDKYLCRTFAREIVRGVAATAEHLGARAVFAIKAEYRAEIDALSSAIQSHIQGQGGAGISIHEMPSFYPAGDEQTMVQLVTGRSIPERGLPLDVGAVVQNVGTMLNVAQALDDGGPVMDKFLSVTGAVVKPVVLRVPVGTSVRDCVAQAELQPPLLSQGYAALLGGPMMGRILTDPGEIDKAVVTKTTGNVALLPLDHYLVRRARLSIERMRHQARSACVQCRMCTDLCPRYLIGHEIRPHLVMRNVWREASIPSDEEYVRSFGDALNCCDCGLCEMFSCPMGLSPRRINSYFKQRFREKGLNKERNMTPEASRFVNGRRVPTGRLYARLGLGGWHGVHVRAPHSVLTPREVYIPFSQHIGKPALPVVKAGDIVERGTLIAAAQEGVSANVHTGLAGRVESVDAKGARIVATQGEVNGHE